MAQDAETNHMVVVEKEADVKLTSEARDDICAISLMNSTKSHKLAEVAT